MAEYRVLTTQGGYSFKGRHLKEKETNNWHFYETVEGHILHFRKEHMVMVVEIPEVNKDGHAESQL
jgi:hypothetical protein